MPMTGPHTAETIAKMRLAHQRPVRDRLFQYSSPEPNTGCWLWTGFIAPNGYASISVEGRRAYAHRASYEAFVGPIPPTLSIDHLCRQRSCVNPEHLEPVTARVNNLRGHGIAAANAAKTTCPHGHSLADARVYRGERHCKPCGRRRSRVSAQNAALAGGGLN